MRHEVARTVVCYGYIVNKPAVPSAESIGTYVVRYICADMWCGKKCGVKGEKPKVSLRYLHLPHHIVFSE